MSDDINNPHDRLFKAVFSQPDQAAAWFAGALPSALVEQLDLDSLQTLDGSFVDEALRERHADLLFSVSSKGGAPVLLYLLFEHQSTPDALMAWRLLRYSVRVWDRWTTENPKATRLPPVVPLVLYQGKATWTSPMSMRAQLDGGPALHASMDELGVDLRCALADVGRTDDAALWGRSLGVMAQLLMKHAADGDLWERLEDWVQTLSSIHDESGLRAVELVLRYIVGIVERPPDKRVEQLLRQSVEPEAVEALMTWADQLREEGLQKGLQEGEGAGVRKALLRLLAKRFGDVPDGVHTRVMAADGDALLAAIDRAVTASTIDEIFEG